MHLGIPALLDFYRQHRGDASLVLATIIGTEGHTYRKPGAMMLISHGGQFEGMISGGCLEGDLLEHAARVLEDGEPRFVTYDLYADEDLVWNLGIGCDGVIHLLLQRLDRASDFEFLPALDSAMGGRSKVLLALVTQSEGAIAPGSWALSGADGRTAGAEELQRALEAAAAGGWPEWRYQRAEEDDPDSVLLINIPPPTRILICGAGPDAVPVARTVAGLGWEAVLVDHRPAYARSDRFPASCEVIMTRPERLAEEQSLDAFDAAVIMSHNLEHDADYLRQLCGREIPYVGVLGPAARRERLLEMTECASEALRGPVGLDIGAELPESIALSLVAEIHAVLNGRDGLPLTRLNDRDEPDD